MLLHGGTAVYRSVITVLAQMRQQRRSISLVSCSSSWIRLLHPGRPPAALVKPVCFLQTGSDLNLRQVCGCVASQQRQSPLSLINSSGSGLLRAAGSDTQSEGRDRTAAASTAAARRPGRCSAQAQPVEIASESPTECITLPRRYSTVVQVLLVSEFSASIQQLFLPDKQPASNHSAAFREGTADKKEWIRTDRSQD